MTQTALIDHARLLLLLTELRLPTIKTLYPQFTAQADKEGWPAVRLLAGLTEHEVAERARRRIERHLADGSGHPRKRKTGARVARWKLVGPAGFFGIRQQDPELELRKQRRFAHSSD